MKNYQKIFLIALSLLLLVYANCQKDNPVSVSSLKTDAPVSLKINFIESAKNFLDGQSSKKNVNYVEVTITGVGLSNPINLILNISNNEAKGKVNLPFGLKDIEVTASVKSGSIKIPLFHGLKGVSITESTSSVTIDLTEITEYERDLYLHDGIFESRHYSSNKGDILAAYFDISNEIGEPVFVKSISYYLICQGNSGYYRNNIQDEFHAVRFRSPNPLVANSDGYAGWDFTWGDPLKGIFTSGIYAGLEYESYSGWPAIGYDYNDPTWDSKWYKSNENLWYYMNNGDFAITLTVQTQSGKIYKLTPSKIVPDGGKEILAGSISKLK